MWCLSPRAGASSGMENCGGRWARYSASWRSRKRVGSTPRDSSPANPPTPLRMTWDRTKLALKIVNQMAANNRINPPPWAAGIAGATGPGLARAVSFPDEDAAGRDTSR
jgi:hypothetical protein